MSLRYCKSCGSQLGEAAKMCINCGSLVAYKATDRSLPEDILQTWGRALKKVNEAADRFLPVDGGADFCVNCGIKLTNANREGNTKKCCKCWKKEEEAAQKPSVMAIRGTFAYNRWLQRHGSEIEIISCTVSKPGTLTGRTSCGHIYHVVYKPKTPQHDTIAPRQTDRQASGADIADQIEKLGRLRDQGLLTDDEFQSKKEDLLARL